MTAENLLGLYSANLALWEILVKSNSVDKLSVATTFYTFGGSV